MSQTRLSEIADAYVKIRKTRSAHKKDFEIKDKELKAIQDQLETAALSILTDADIQSQKTNSGVTVYVSETERFSVKDRDQLEEFALKNKAIDIFGNTLSKDVLIAIREKEGELPPGVGTFTVRKANFRSS